MNNRPKLNTDLPDTEVTVLIVTNDVEYSVWVAQQGQSRQPAVLVWNYDVIALFVIRSSA